MLNVEGGVARLAELTAAPTVAIVGARRASDYGVEMAKSVARGLAASGVTVAGGLCDGIEVAAHAGALEVNGATVAVLSGGLHAGPPAKRRSLYERLRHRGCGSRSCRVTLRHGAGGGLPASGSPSGLPSSW